MRKGLCGVERESKSCIHVVVLFVTRAAVSTPPLITNYDVQLPRNPQCGNK